MSKREKKEQRAKCDGVDWIVPTVTEQLREVSILVATFWLMMLSFTTSTFLLCSKSSLQGEHIRQ
jgi:hypothetical protein